LVKVEEKTSLFDTKKLPCSIYRTYIYAYFKTKLKILIF